MQNTDKLREQLLSGKIVDIIGFEKTQKVYKETLKVFPNHVKIKESKPVPKWIEATVKPKKKMQDVPLLLMKRNKQNANWNSVRQGHLGNGMFYIEGGRTSDEYISHYQLLELPHHEKMKIPV